MLRSDVPKLSVLDPHHLRYRSAARAVTGLLDDRDEEQIALLLGELAGGPTGLEDLAQVEEVVEKSLRPPQGVDRAVQLLSDERGVEAHAEGDATVVLDEPVDGRVPEPALIRALFLADETGPVFARASTEDGQPVLAAWCAPWLAVERTGPNGLTRVRAWRTIAGLFPLVGRFELPRSDAQSIAGDSRPHQVADLLAAADEDGGPRYEQARSGPGRARLE
jgi:hypothetical protein